ncbi:hypothetical protein EPA93_25855 [Ktedonosporobacter rubrisoli]|uniref:Uncharacterized protein n=1 Tax=Ktedonosporobacter rubrisoli TaxID=2509675 RepID=A0A4P6JV61_KTERU|nr:hypothetical protein [Ktedonosporobacter rubrisoli]QBD79220.1 hypothetical protein EPA93_25855 [Ktedonosporobacter rubrisoli]
MLPEPYTEQDTAPAFPGMSLHDFMERTAVYEHTPVAFPPRLRRAAWLGMGFTLITVSIILLIPVLGTGMRALYFPFMLGALNHFLESYLHWLVASVWIRYVDGALLGSALVLLLLTRNLRQGRLEQQWLAFIQALAGCLNLLLLMSIVLLILPNILLWIISILTVLILVAAFFGVFSPSPRRAS